MWRPFFRWTAYYYNEIRHFRETTRRRRIVEESVEEPPQNPVIMAMVPDPSWNPLGSPVRADAATTPLASNKNKTDQKNRELWMQTHERTLVLLSWKINRVNSEQTLCDSWIKEQWQIRSASVIFQWFLSAIQWHFFKRLPSKSLIGGAFVSSTNSQPTTFYKGRT